MKAIIQQRRALEHHGKYVLIGHEGFGASGNRVWGLVPRFITLILLSRFVSSCDWAGPGFLPGRTPSPP